WLGDVTGRLLCDVEAHGLPLEPVRAGWTEAVALLARQLAPMPTHVDGELLVEVEKPSVRRSAGVVVLAGIEVLLSAVLARLLWYVGERFIAGEGVSASMPLSAVTLVAVLLFAGHTVAN